MGVGSILTGSGHGDDWRGVGPQPTEVDVTTGRWIGTVMIVRRASRRRLGASAACGQ